MVTRRGALGLVPFLISGCDLVLGIPNPDEVKDIEMVGERLCNECDGVVQQGAEVISACQSGVDEGGEEGLKVLAEADCDVCANSSKCYGLATGAGDIGSSCASHAECRSYACCVTNLSTSIFDQSVVVTGECCDACVGCSGLFAPGVEWYPPMCLELLSDLLTPAGELNPENELIALSTCLCTAQGALQCFNAGRCPNPTLPQNDCQALLAEPDCRDCLFGAVDPPDSCKPQIDACTADANRPRL